MVTTHQINDRHFHRQSIHSRRDGQNLIGGIRHEEVGVSEGEWKQMQLEELEDGVGRCHWDMQNELHVSTIVEIRSINL